MVVHLPPPPAARRHSFRSRPSPNRHRGARQLGHPAHPRCIARRRRRSPRLRHGAGPSLATRPHAPRLTRATRRNRRRAGSRLRREISHPRLFSRRRTRFRLHGQRLSRAARCLCARRQRLHCSAPIESPARIQAAQLQAHALAAQRLSGDRWIHVRDADGHLGARTRSRRSRSPRRPRPLQRPLFGRSANGSFRCRRSQRPQRRFALHAARSARSTGR